MPSWVHPWDLEAGLCEAQPETRPGLVNAKVYLWVLLDVFTKFIFEMFIYKNLSIKLQS